MCTLAIYNLTWGRAVPAGQEWPMLMEGCTSRYGFMLEGESKHALLLSVCACKCCGKKRAAFPGFRDSRVVFVTAARFVSPYWWYKKLRYIYHQGCWQWSRANGGAEWSIKQISDGAAFIFYSLAIIFSLALCLRSCPWLIFLSLPLHFYLFFCHYVTAGTSSSISFSFQILPT